MQNVARQLSKRSLTILPMRFLATLTLLAAISSSLSAAVMIQPTSVTANAGFVHSNYNINRLIDQARSTVSYTSGVTDYATYLAAGPVAAPFGTSLFEYAALFDTPNLVLEFDLGTAWSISNIILWNAPQTAARIQSFSVIVSDSATFGTVTSLGPFAATGSAAFPMEAQGFTFTSPVEGRYVRITATSYHASTTLLGEVAFAGNAIPEPSAALLGAVGAIALLRRRR